MCLIGRKWFSRIPETKIRNFSSETEIKLIGVARASLEEVLEDYRDCLRTHRLALWVKDDPRTLQLRALAKQKDKSHETYKAYLASDDRELISLIHQTNFLLDRQLKSLEKQFVERGGLRERMFAARKAAREGKTQKPACDFFAGAGQAAQTLQNNRVR